VVNKVFDDGKVFKQLRFNFDDEKKITYFVIGVDNGDWL